MQRLRRSRKSFEDVYLDTQSQATKDRSINHDLNKNGFHVIRIWQSDIQKDANKCSEKIITIIKQLVDSKKTVTTR